MNRIKILFFLLCPFPIWLLAQETWLHDYGRADSLAALVPDSVTTDADQFAAFLRTQNLEDDEVCRVIYTWLAKNIYYDTDKVGETEVYRDEYEMIRNTLTTKRGVCQHFAEVFTEICGLYGIECYTVNGYTRPDTAVDLITGHAWNITHIGNNWQLYDATWGSGFIKAGRYIKKFSPAYFMIPPDSMIAHHCPFDPQWQLLDYPVTHGEFISGIRKGVVFFSYPDTIAGYINLGRAGKVEATLRRAMQYGFGIHEMDIYRQKLQALYNIELFNQCITDINLLISNINLKSELNRNRFNSSSLQADEKAAFITDLERCKTALDRVSPVSEEISAGLTELRQHISEIETLLLK